ncbi:MAG: nucleoside-diphosphate sugar epimerase/dehydratase [Flavobacteriales bacterium]|nr:nucleoside-diphosphate sugar epimerase/dehydratase [Flavobacteriales bacterium]
MKRPWLFPRWGIVVLDLVLCMVALAAAYQLRFNFNVPPLEYRLLWPMLPVYIGVRLAWYLAFGIQRSMVRHTGTNDARRVFLAVLGGTLTLLLLNGLRYALVDGKFVLPTSVTIIEFMGSAMLLITARIAFKLLHLRRQGKGKGELRVVLYGAGEAGLITLRTLEREGSVNYRVTAFADDDRGKAGKRLEGVRIVHTSELPKVLEREHVDQLIITVQRPDPEHRRQVVDMAMHARTQVRTVPPVHDWINGELSSGQIREVRIEDLLGRAPIQLDDALVRERFAGRRVLVTGAAGSIGSELVRQLIAMDAELTLVDMAESALYDLEMELRGAGHHGFAAIVGDVRDRPGMDRLFARARPQVVFHAAAYKHVPLMEARPGEAVRTNIGGTRTVAELAVAHGVEEFILISTDKAVNPTSVMGATKRTAEMVVGTLAGRGTAFITTRFGNVLGSNGSVIPLFRRQIAAGGPVTVTDPEVTRYFMTIREACRLVLEAATMGHGGEIYVFDMGQAVRIADLAERMVRLSGKEPGRDIEIVYTGLRPGEKRYEELLASAENTLPTHHPRILIGRVRAADADQVRQAVDTLLAAAARGDDRACVEAMHALVPEYVPGGAQEVPSPTGPAFRKNCPDAP